MSCSSSAMLKQHGSTRSSRLARHVELNQTVTEFGLQSTKGRFHRLGLTPQLANPRLRDNQGLSTACVPSASVNLTAHLTRDLTSFR